MDGNTIDADYTAESPDQDAEDMEAVKANIRNGNGSAPAAKPAQEKPKETAKPAAKEPPAETPAEEETAARTPEITDNASADLEIVYQDFRSRILSAANQPAAVEVYTEAAQDSVLGPDHLAKLQSDLRAAVSKFRGGK